MDHRIDIGEQPGREAKSRSHASRCPYDRRHQRISQHRKTDRLAIVEDRLALSRRQPEFPHQSGRKRQAVVDYRGGNFDPPRHRREQYGTERQQLEERIADDQ